MSDLPFQIGDTYHRVEDIHEEYGGNRYSGIAPTADYPYVFIFYGESGEWHGYDDEFTDNGRFLYIGEGRDGDMTMDGGNAAIREHAKSNSELHVFEIGEGAWEVRYVGEFEYRDHVWTRLPDRNDQMRDAIRFELEPVGGVDINVGQRIDSLSLDELYDLAVDAVSGERSPSDTAQSSSTYPRSDIVKTYARKRADGVCEGCGEEAPFIDENGNPYLEVHNMHRRSDGGPDHPDNVVALCPNCHQRVHRGKDGDEFNESLIEEFGRKMSSL